MLGLLFLLLPLAQANLASAKSISSPYLTFEVPETYSCESYEAYFQCQDSTGPRMKDSILIITFKRVGPQDSLEQYSSLLSKPFTRQNPSGPPVLSQVLGTSRTKIKDWDWVTAKHFESDLSNYYTYYWTTLRGPVAMVVKYSVLKKSDSARQKDIKTLADSLTTKNVSFSPPVPASPDGAAPNVGGQERADGILQKVMNLPPTKKYLLFGILMSVLLFVVYAVIKK
jgi:hypothetical protein